MGCRRVGVAGAKGVGAFAGVYGAIGCAAAGATPPHAQRQDRQEGGTALGDDLYILTSMIFVVAPLSG
jgi:hypothetical protein